MLDASTNRSPVTRATRFAVAALVLAVALPIAGLAVYAQSAGFGGTVFDPTHRSVAGVTVALKNAKTGDAREVKTDAQGRFEFSSLPEGEYAFEARLPGFMTVKGTAVVTGKGLKRDLNLQLGSLRETIVILGGQGPAAPAGSPAAPKTVAPRPPCTPSAGGGAVVPPRKLEDSRPAYPPSLATGGVSGTVEVEGIVGKDGKVHGAKVVQAPHPDLGRAVVEAVNSWLFEPTLLNCDPVEVKIGVTAKFELK